MEGQVFPKELFHQNKDRDNLSGTADPVICL
jgi:hypothetical protein